MTVTISSPTQIGGAQSRPPPATRARFRFQGLFPGVFKVSASAPKLRTVVQEGVRVGQAARPSVALVMEVDTGQEEQITVIQKAPEINTRTSTVGESFDIDFLNSLPLATRDFQGAAALAAGVTDVTGSGNPEVRGGLYFNNKYSVDGFDTTDPVTSTFGQNFSFNAMANLEVSTAGAGGRGRRHRGRRDQHRHPVGLEPLRGRRRGHLPGLPAAAVRGQAATAAQTA